MFRLFVPQAVLRGLYNVVRSLPDHSVVEGEELAGTMTALLRKCLYNEQPLKVKGWGEGDGGGLAAQVLVQRATPR